MYIDEFAFRKLKDILPDLWRLKLDSVEYVVLIHLIMLQGQDMSCYPNLDTLGEYANKSKPTVEKAVKNLKDLQYIQYVQGTISRSNEYQVQYGKIVADIYSKLDAKELGDRAKKELSEYVKDKITIQRNLKKPELAHKSETLMGNKVIDDNGEILNGYGIKIERDIEV